MTKILQLKIVLKGSKPPVWRRFLVKDSMTFHKLHNIIQDVMGWKNCHLYEFTVGGLSIGIPDEDYGDEIEDSGKILLSELMKHEKQTFGYMYDFGDSWEHAVTVEKIMETETPQKCPVCIKGKMACPPEDCGGVWGYEELLEALKDPNHPEHKEMKEWVGGSFDPKDFDIDDVNAMLNRLRQ